MPDDETEYNSIDHLIETLYENQLSKSIFCQYWKMEKYISSKQVLERHIEHLFKFKQWKVQEQLSYVNDSDLQLFEAYHPVMNTKTNIVCSHPLCISLHIT